MAPGRRLLLFSALSALTPPGCSQSSNSPGLPMVINTWGGPFTAATDAAYLSLLDPGTSALDAVELGCATCEANQCDGSVGYGGSPDENCEVSYLLIFSPPPPNSPLPSNYPSIHLNQSYNQRIPANLHPKTKTTLDAMIMDGTTMKSGAVAALRRIRSAIAVARHVLEHTTHTLLAGDLATDFAVASGFVAENLTTDDSAASCAAWRAAGCQPNYRLNVTPDPSTSCGPYEPLALAVDSRGDLASESRVVGHDTISMIALHASGSSSSVSMAAGTSTNGAGRKVPGRVGDGPITGSGSYVDGDVGGCGATGDGDVMMRFLPCYQAVENLRRGMTPTQAAEDAVRRMVRKYPDVASGIVVVDNRGRHGGAGSGWTFTYAYRGGGMNATAVVSVPPVDGGSGDGDL